MLTWYTRQAKLAADHGISYSNWKRISALLKDLPPKRIGDRLGSCSVTLGGRAMVARAAVQGAFTEPLRESVRNAAAFADADAERKRKGKEKGNRADALGQRRDGRLT